MPDACKTPGEAASSPMDFAGPAATTASAIKTSRQERRRLKASNTMKSPVSACGDRVTLVLRSRVSGERA